MIQPGAAGGRGDAFLAGVRRSAQLPPGSHAARDHSSAGGAGGELARLYARGDAPGLYRSSPVHAASADGNRARKRPELRDRGPDRQPDQRELLESAGNRRHPHSGKAVPIQDRDPQQQRAAGHRDPGDCAADPGGPGRSGAEIQQAVPAPQHGRADAPPRDGQDRAGSGEPAFPDYTDRATVAAAEAGAARRGAESRAEPARAGSRAAPPAGPPAAPPSGGPGGAGTGK